MAKRRKYRQSKSQLTPILVIAGGLALVIAALWLTSRPASTELAEPAAPTTNLGPYPQVERVPLTEAKSAFDNDSALIVDVRSEQEYLTAHIPGALWFPSSEIATHYQELSQDKPIYLYCT